MTVMAERTSKVTPRMSVEEFERIAEFAAVESESVRLEFIGGRIGVKKMPDGDHGTIIMWLIRQCMQLRPDLDLDNMQGLRVGKYRKGRARPDGALAPVGHFEGQGEWADPDGVLMVLEVTSFDSDTHSRDRKEKPSAYADAGIPAYLLIDRDDFTLTVHSVPDAATGAYRHRETVAFGERVVLPDPIGIELDTGNLKRYMR
ncbi:Uma2 family endonuclease [Streptomyces sp. NPDC093109]|uniref:Uma2 family endonuclease n=1 Tax=Streptomyces sp. NPDC093109 TaxID=3154977 RepID=UPI00344B237B